MVIREYAYFKNLRFSQKVQLLYIVFELFNSCVYYQFKIIPNFVYICIFAGLSIFMFLYQYIKGESNSHNKIFIYCMAIILLMIISSIYRSAYINNLQKTIKTILIQIIWFFLLLYTPATTEHSNLIEYHEFYIHVFVLVVSFTLLVSFTNLLLWFITAIIHIDISSYTSLKIVEEHRLSALYFNANLTGIVSLISILLMLYIHQNVVHKNLVLLIIGISIQMLTLILSGSRSALLCLVAFIAFIIFKVYFRSQKLNRAKKILIIISITAIVIAALIIMTAYRLGSITYFLNDISSNLDILTSHRYSLWLESLRLFCTSPVIGNGFYTMPELARAVIGKSSIIAIRSYQQPHNFIIGALYHTGVLGALCLFLLLKLTIDRIESIFAEPYKNKTILIFIVLSMIVYSLFNPGFIFATEFPSPVIWLILGKLSNN